MLLAICVTSTAPITTLWDSSRCWGVMSDPTFIIASTDAARASMPGIAMSCVGTSKVTTCSSRLDIGLGTMLGSIKVGDGSAVGSGNAVGSSGSGVGSGSGVCVGVGSIVGTTVSTGAGVGSIDVGVGSGCGICVGIGVGSNDGSRDGIGDGSSVGVGVGSAVAVGSSDGVAVGVGAIPA